MVDLSNIMPYDTDAESGVICSLIVEPEYFNMSEFLKPNHFYNEELGAIYWAISNLIEDGIYEIDSFNLTIKCNENKGIKKLIDKYGGDSFIKELVENSESVSRDTLDEYLLVAKRVSELGFRRELYRKLKSYEKEVLNDEKPLSETHSKIITGLDDIGNEYIGSEKVVLFKDRVDLILDKLEEKRKRSEDGVIGMRTAWSPLSELISYESGDLYLFAARRKEGKSLLLLTEAIHKAKMGLKVAMSSTEMSDEKDMIRMLSILSGIPVDEIRRGNIQGYNEQKYLDAIHFTKHADFTREYHPVWTREMLYSRMKAIKHKFGGLDFIVHDYIKDVESTDSSKKYNELGKWADHLKNHIAGTFEVPVISAVQLNRQMAIADSDLLERSASCGIKWIPKSKEEILEDGIECGNYKMQIFFSRDGGEMEEDEYLDFYMDKNKHTTNLRIHEAKKQHSESIPEFME